MNFSKLTTLHRQILLAFFTFFVYALVFNLKLSIILMAAIGFHECCHLLAAKRMGLKTGGIEFIPFVGALSYVLEKYKTYAQQAFVVLAGPIGGGLFAVITYVIFYITKIPAFGTAAKLMTWINLFNLLPLSFLDGGQVMNTITFSINEKLGIVLKVVSTIVAVIVIWALNPIISVLVFIYGGYDCYKEISSWYYKSKGKSFLVSNNYSFRPGALSTQQILYVTGAWLITAGCLLVLSTLLSNVSLTGR